MVTDWKNDTLLLVICMFIGLYPFSFWFYHTWFIDLFVIFVSVPSPHSNHFPFSSCFCRQYSAYDHLSLITDSFIDSFLLSLRIITCFPLVPLLTSLSSHSQWTILRCSPRKCRLLLLVPSPPPLPLSLPLRMSPSSVRDSWEQASLRLDYGTHYRSINPWPV